MRGGEGVMNPSIEYRVFWNDRGECRDGLPGPWVGEALKGSFIVYVCDQVAGHDGHHIDSVAGVAWSDDARVPLAMHAVIG